MPSQKQNKRNPREVADRVSGRSPGILTWVGLFAMILFLTLDPVSADQAEISPIGVKAPNYTTYFEAGADYMHYTNDYSDGNSQFLAVTYSRDWAYLLRFDGGRYERFGDAGLGFSGSLSLYFSNKWSVGFGAGTGTGKFILPRYRLDAWIGKAFLGEGTLNTGIGYTHEQSRLDNYYDRIHGWVTWYNGTNWIIEGSFNYDIGQPGETFTTTGQGGVTWYLWQKRYIGGLLAYGDVNYTVVGPTDVLVGYTEMRVRLHYTEYLNRTTGLVLKLDAGKNDFYDTFGVSLSIFKQW